MGLLGSIAAAVVVGAALAPWLPFAPLPWLAIGLGAALAAAWRPVTGVLAGLALGVLCVAGLPDPPRWEGPVVVQGVIVGAATGRSADLAVARWTRTGEAWREGPGRVRVRFGGRPPAPGVAVLVEGRAAPVAPRALPGAPDPVRAARRGRVLTEVRARSVAVLGGTAAPADPFAGVRHGPVLRALVTGDREGIDPGTWRRLRRTGTAHLLAISGFHVGLVALVGVGLARGLLRALALWRPGGMRDGPAWAVGVAVGVLYAAAVGWPPSAQRAAAVLGLYGVARATGRRIEPLRLLLVAAAVQCLVDPASLGTAGFQLSYGAVLGLIRVTPRLLALLPPDLPRPAAWVAASVATTVGATVGTLPAAAWWFQEVAPLGALGNLVAIPVVALLLLPLAAVGWVAPPALSEPAVTAASLVLDALLAVLAPLDVAPWTPAVGPVGALLLLGVLLAPGRPLWLGAVLLVALGVREVPVGDTVTFLDVGQGSAALVERADGRRWLVDGGPPGTAVLRWLRRRHVRRLDVVVASHGHPDHAGGLLPVLGALEVGQLWVPDEEGLQRLLRLARRRGVTVVRQPGLPGLGINDRSLVVATAGVVFPGDVEARGEQRPLPSGRVLLVPHHGSRTSSTPRLLAEVGPSLAVVSAGRDNRFGHPHPLVVDRYREAEIPLLRTDLQGTIEVTLPALSVRTWLAGRGWRADRAID